MFQHKIGVNKDLIEKKANGILKKMTLKEKIWLLNGNWNGTMHQQVYGSFYNPIPIPTNGNIRYNIPPVAFCDGPRGVVMGNSTCFPVSMARGATFDRHLEYRVGQVIALEARGQGSNYFGGVCINLLRHPAWGRAQETYGEDPYHVGEFGLSLTESVQEHGVMACVKHYALNNIENSRFDVSIECDDRSLHEIYLPHYKKCVVDGGAASLMGSYNKFRGDQMCESKEIMTSILRDMWGFEGFVCSDFLFGIRDAKKALEAGCDVEMPSPIHYQKGLLKKVEKGEIDESFVDISALRVLRTSLAFYEMETKQESYARNIVACKSHTDLALEVAEKSMVLMKNKNNVLPFDKNAKKILVVGDWAKKQNDGDKGSSEMRSQYVVTPLEGIKNAVSADTEVIFCGNDDLDSAATHALTADSVLLFVGYDETDEGECLVPLTNTIDYKVMCRGKWREGKKIEAAITYAVMTIKNSAKDVQISDEEGKGIGGDRSNLSLRFSHIDLINKIAPLNKNTVVNLVGGSMINTSEWDHNTPAIIHNWYSGMEGGNAVANVIFGNVNPSGKMPFSTTDCQPYFSSSDMEVTYDYYHGYYLLDKKNVKADYAFGHGLSYTTFELSNHSCDKLDDRIRVSVDVTNTGGRAGAEVVQAYVGYEGSKIERHKKELKGFDRVELDAGETKTVTMNVMLKELEYFDVSTQQFVFEDMDYQIYVGNSSDCLVRALQAFERLSYFVSLSNTKSFFMSNAVH